MDTWTAVATALAGVLVGGFVTYVLQRARLSYEDCRAAVERDWAADPELRTLVRVFGEMALRDHQATQGRQSEGEEALWGGRHLEAIYARLIARGNDCRLWASIVPSSA